MVIITSFSPPTEGLRHVQSSTELLINGHSSGTGTLYIAESALCWGNETTGQGYSFMYPSIGVHGVTTDASAFGYEFLYLMIDADLTGETNEDSGEEGDGDSSGCTELRFIPQDRGQLQAMYQAMTHCQSLHPDYIPSDSDGEDFHDADEEGECNLGGGDSGYIEDHVNERTNGWNHHEEEEDMETEGQFEDAED